MSKSTSYIAYLDLLGTKSFCEEEDVYYKNINTFSRTVKILAPKLGASGRIGIFSDCVYVECTELESMLNFLNQLRLMLLGDGLFFNAALSKGKAGVEPIITPHKKEKDDKTEKDESILPNLFGVRFTNKEIASIYCKQTKFRGVGIWIDPLVEKEIALRGNYKVVESIYYAKENKDNTNVYLPKRYNDIAFFNNNDDDLKDWESYINGSMKIIFKTIYKSHRKSSKYSVYYIPMIVNIIRCCDVNNLKWNKTKKSFENMTIEFKLMYNFLLEVNKTISNLIGFDCVCLVLLDKIYSSTSLTNYDKAAITEDFIDKFSCLNSKYKLSLDLVPKEPFSDDNRSNFINYCNDDMARQFVSNILDN